jgi:hypothetical protein
MKKLTKAYEAEQIESSLLNDFEVANRLQLSNNFKQFYLEYQGSKVKEILFFDITNEMWVLNSFFELKEMDLLFLEFLEAYKRKLIPFAFDPGGWHFCLCMDEKDFGAIIVNRWTDHLPEEQFLKIADSFEEFVNGLKREDEV